MKKLDKTRPYGTVHGDSEGRRFHQDDTYFDVHGNEVGAAPETPPSDDDNETAGDDTAGEQTTKRKK